MKSCNNAFKYNFETHYKQYFPIGLTPVVNNRRKHKKSLFAFFFFLTVLVVKRSCLITCLKSMFYLYSITIFVDFCLL